MYIYTHLHLLCIQVYIYVNLYRLILYYYYYCITKVDVNSVPALLYNFTAVIYRLDFLLSRASCLYLILWLQRLGDGYSASHIAIDNDDEECLQVCLEAKADSEVRNYKGETPQQLAYLCGSHRMVELCQKFGAGEYQLEHAETEPVLPDEEEDMETEVSLRS